MALTVKTFSATSGPAQHPSVSLVLEKPWKIIGGGAFDNWSGFGNLLTAAFPTGLQTWTAAGKDHEVPSPAPITAFVRAIEDPNDEWDVTIQHETSDPGQHPTAIASLPDGFTLTGGGAFVDWHAAGNLLTASFPRSDGTSWEARSKDQDIADLATITAFAIGIKHKDPKVKVRHHIRSAKSAVASHPSVDVSLEPGWILSGGGALDEWTRNGNLLTATFPISDTAWRASGKDQSVPDPAAIIAFVIGIRVD